MSIELAICFIAFLVLLVLCLEAIKKIDYRIGTTYLEVRLFGLSLRRIRLDDIERISKRRRGFCETWPNTTKPRKRVLVLKRRSGLFRSFLITPSQRYVFKYRLKLAIDRLEGKGGAGVVDEDSLEGTDGDLDDSEQLV